MDEEENNEIVVVDSAPTAESEAENVPAANEKPKLLRLPLSRVKSIMKMDPDCVLVRSEVVFLITKATELFLEYLGKESMKFTLRSKRKTVLRRDVDAAIENISHLCFLDGALEK